MATSCWMKETLIKQGAYFWVLDATSFIKKFFSTFGEMIRQTIKLLYMFIWSKCEDK